MINLYVHHGIAIDYFVTADNNILENKKDIENITDAQVVSPSNLTKIEKI